MNRRTVTARQRPEARVLPATVQSAPGGRRAALAALASVAAMAALAGPAAAAGAGAPAGSFELVTEADVQAERLAADAPRTRSMPRPGAPAIRVVTPQQLEPPAPVPQPLRIELAFEAAGEGRIVPQSFRMLYGRLKLDLTERMRRHSTISERGVLVEGAQLPDGMHRLFVQVSDDKGNQAEQELRVRVGGPR